VTREQVNMDVVTYAIHQKIRKAESIAKRGEVL